VQFRSWLGDIEVELLGNQKPVTTTNFLQYVTSGAYEGMFLHRAIPGFIVQGGGFSVTNRASSEQDPSFIQVPNFGTIPNEYDQGPEISNTYGTLAMAKLPEEPDSASSQWFFNLGDNSENLDQQNGGFTVFGRVVSGTNVLNQFNEIEPDLQIINATPDLPFEEWPVRNTDGEPADLDDLVYVDVTLLEVNVELTMEAEQRISWNSLSNRLHRVYYTEGMPPEWQTLVETNGTGERMSVVDSDANGEDEERFYRVEVVYGVGEEEQENE
jgi:cyclophilin family peptidyl-prolyl cis-trans isomerase